MFIIFRIRVFLLFHHIAMCHFPKEELDLIGFAHGKKKIILTFFLSQITKKISFGFWLVLREENEQQHGQQHSLGRGKVWHSSDTMPSFSCLCWCSMQLIVCAFRRNLLLVSTNEERKLNRSFFKKKKMPTLLT